MASASVIQEGNLRISVSSQIKPYKLPRKGTAPIAVFVAGHLQSAQGGIPPQLQGLRIDVNRHGLLQSKGLPVCQIPQVQPASTERALARLRRRPDRLGPVLGPHRPARPGRLPDPGSPADLQRPQGGHAGDPRPHLHLPPLQHLLRHPLLDQARLQGALRHRAYRVPAPGPRRLGLPGPDQAHPAPQIPLPGQAALLLQRRLPGAGHPSAPPSRSPTPNSPSPGASRWGRP